MNDSEPPASTSAQTTPAKVVLLVIAGGADPVGQSTPLVEAETPTLDRLAREGYVGRAVLAAGTCWDGFTALLGAAPGHCALGPCDARAAGVELAAGQTAARLDLVTVDEGGMLDPHGGRVRDAEAAVLFDALGAHLEGGHLVRLARGRGLLIVEGAVEAPPPPWHFLDAGDDPDGGARPARSLASAFPRGGLARRLFEASKAALAGHDVNAVRVDLGETPANAAWLHGAGGPPTATAPVWAAGRVAIVSRPGPAAGLAALLGCSPVTAEASDEDLGAAALAALSDHDVVVVRTVSVLEAGTSLEAGPAAAPRARSAALSGVDARLAAPLLGALEERGPYVFAVATDGVFDSLRRSYSAEPVSFGILHADPAGRAAHAGQAASAFSEAACDGSGHRLESPAAFAALVAKHVAAVSPE